MVCLHRFASLDLVSPRQVFSNYHSGMLDSPYTVLRPSISFGSGRPEGQLSALHLSPPLAFQYQLDFFGNHSAMLQLGA